MFKNWQAAIAGGGYRDLPGSISARFTDGAVPRRRRWFREGVGRLKGRGWPIVQTAVAASLSWYLAALLLGHEKPFVAPIAAVIALGAAADRRGRRAFEWIFGVALGLTVADGIVSVIGTGTVQIGVLVL